MWMESKCEGVGHISTTLGLSLTFPNYEFGKGQYAYYPVKQSRFDEKIKLVGNTQFHKREPLP